MPYSAPTLAMLLQNIPSQDMFPDETPSHLLLADQLTTFTQFISEEEKKQNGNSDELTASLIGARVCFLEIISQEYYFHSPELKLGYIYNSGSPFYSFMSKGLNITAENPLSTRDKFIYLVKFNQFILKKNPELEIQLRPQIKMIFTHLLYALTANIETIVNAVPTEKAITKHMYESTDQYQHEKALQSNSWTSYFFPPSKEHLMLTQLERLISTIECEDESLIPSNIMTRSQRIKLGLSTYITKKIEKKYWIRSATNSVLYSNTKKLLNSNSIENLDSAQKLACLSAFHSFISSHDERSKLETTARKYFKENNLLENIDTLLNSMCKNLDEMENELENTSSTNWPATKAMCAAGVILGSAPSYGLGSVIGLTVSESQYSNLPKTAIGTTVSNLATAVFQSNSAGYFSFVMGDFLIKSTLTRAFAKLFEFIGMTIGGVAGGLIGFTFDLTYKGLREVCKRLLNYCDDNPVQMRNADRELIQSLLDLPDDLFAEEKQNKILYALGNEDKENRENREESECKIEENNRSFVHY